MGQYKLGLVGESKYQPAIKGLFNNQTIILQHEPDNKFDPRAIRATALGETIGYVARDSWLHSAMLDQRQEVFARVVEVTGAGRKSRGVVLAVWTGVDAEVARNTKTRPRVGCTMAVGSLLLAAAITSGMFSGTAKAEEQCGDPGTPAGLRLIDAGIPPCKIASRPKRVAPVKPRPATPAQIGSAKRHFSNILKDADTARWKEWTSWPGGYVCGYVNAKNSFGGYVGWQRFWYRAGDGTIVDDGLNVPLPAEQVPCLGPPRINWQAEAMRDLGN